jgi:hypothetical protein
VREEDASGPQIRAIGRVPHTVRGFLAGLAKKGIKIDVLERVRQVGPNKTGAKGTISFIALPANPSANATVRHVPWLAIRATNALAEISKAEHQSDL